MLPIHSILIWGASHSASTNWKGKARSRCSFCILYLAILTFAAWAIACKRQLFCLLRYVTRSNARISPGWVKLKTRQKRRGWLTLLVSHANVLICLVTFGCVLTFRASTTTFCFRKDQQKLLLVNFYILIRYKNQFYIKFTNYVSIHSSENYKLNSKQANRFLISLITLGSMSFACKKVPTIQFWVFR